MGGRRLRHVRSHLLVILLLIWSARLPHLRAQSPGSASAAASRGSLDAVLQDYAYRAFIRGDVRTGVVYDGTVPSNLTGAKVSGIRLRSGSLFTRGVESYKEFEIPVGVLERPYVKRLVLVYQNLGNWSDSYYGIPGHTYLSPVLGLLAYTAVNLSATNLPKLSFRATLNPILIHFSNARAVPGAATAKCVTFDSDGSMNLSSVVSSNTCSATRPGHFGLVVEGTLPPAPAAPARAPAPAPAAPASVPAAPGGKVKEKSKHNRKVWKIVGSAVGGVVLFLLLGLLLLWLKRFKHRKKIQRMERSAEVGEVLRMAPVGSAKAPAAVVTRTQPSLETEYVP